MTDKHNYETAQGVQWIKEHAHLDARSQRAFPVPPSAIIYTETPFTAEQIEAIRAIVQEVLAAWEEGKKEQEKAYGNH